MRLPLLLKACAPQPNKPLVREPEILPRATLILGSFQIVQALLFGHGVPLLLTLAVEVHVEYFGNHVHANVHARDADEHPVAATICWLSAQKHERGSRGFLHWGLSSSR